MIIYNDQYFHLETKNSLYLMKIHDTGHLLQVYYGKKLDYIDIDSLIVKQNFERGSSTSYKSEDRTFSLDNELLEVATYGKGDYREPSIHLEMDDGSRVSDFLYQSHRIYNGKERLEGLPSTYGDATSLEITLKDSIIDVQLVLQYSVFYELDIITRSLKVINGSKGEICIDKVMSMNVDFNHSNFDLITLDGAWVRERLMHTRPVSPGITKIDSKKGVSSANHNPSIVIKDKNTDEYQGEVYGFSLVYSGNFEAVIEENSHQLLRVMMGINSFDFKWYLKEAECFQTPEVVMTYSSQGLNQMSSNFHRLIQQHLVQGEWKDKLRPILINNWEATYFDFTESKLLSLAKRAKKLGVELFVLDDGWFGERVDDTKGLGDYTPNNKKLPNGVNGLVEKINGIGLDFGIWVEPEMVNEESELYRTHPEWVMKLPNRNPSYGRNQLILDLPNPEVQDYIYSQMKNLFDNANITYCKWDMNRNFSDIYSNILTPKEQHGYAHRYVLGLYSILEKLTKDFPHILFESCSSGGNRFDMGMLYYMPQTWTSDNTDGYSRQKIQYGTSLIYPPSTMGCHVSGAPNHQTFRNTSIETRFNVAAFGLLGYELDLTKLTYLEEQAIIKQISFYKKHRRLLQFGQFTRTINPCFSNNCQWQVTNEDKSEIVLGFYQTLSKPNPSHEVIQIPNVIPDFTYHLINREQIIDIRTFGNLINQQFPINLKVNGLLHNTVANHYLLKNEKEDQRVKGSQLMHHGFIPKLQFTGTGYNEQVRIMEDFGSRLYYLIKVTE